MAVPVILPRQGQSVESCIITKWNKKVGDPVKPGDILFTYETDKAAFEEEAKVEGTVLALFFEEGDDVPCLTNVCAIGAPGEDYAAFAPQGEGTAAEQPKAEEPKETASAAVAAVAAQPVVLDEMKISPRARNLAGRRGADLTQVSASGPEGRVIARDVQALIDAGKLVTPAARDGYEGGAQGTGLGGRVSLHDLADKPAQAAAAAPVQAQAPEEDSVVEPLTNIRKVIAKTMHQSLSTMAQLTHNLSFDCTEIMAVRKLFKEKGAPQGMDKITLNDIVLYAVARTLAAPEHRALNAHLLEDNKMRYFRSVNLGVAVDTERGLMVPTLFRADKMSLKQISEQVKQLASECQAGTINPDKLRGGSFTVSNLGSLGIESFTPVINPPQTGILGVNTIVTRVREEKGELKAYPSMCLSLTYDHRALDGAPASRFLRDLKNNLENFTLLLARG